MSRRVVAAVLGALLVAGCGTGTPTNNTRTENMPTPPTEVRHDLEPLTKRFTAIGQPESASWVTWNSESGGVPGPTTYWIDAVITLPPPTTGALVSRYQPSDQGKRPEVQELLRAELPSGRFLTGAALDQALSTSGWQSIAYLDQQANQLVISAMKD